MHQFLWIWSLLVGWMCCYFIDLLFSVCMVLWCILYEFQACEYVIRTPSGSSCFEWPSSSRHLSTCGGFVILKMVVLYLYHLILWFLVPFNQDAHWKNSEPHFTTSFGLQREQSANSSAFVDRSWQWHSTSWFLLALSSETKWYAFFSYTTVYLCNVY